MHEVASNIYFEKLVMPNHKHHTLPIRIYYEDTDTAGIVYYANYLKFAERARTEMLRSCGINQSELLDTHNIGFVVRKVEIKFLKPARLDDLLTITTQLHDINKVSMNMKQIVYKDQEVLVTMQVKIAVVGADLKLANLPDFIQKLISK